jgi:regulatory protein
VAARGTPRHRPPDHERQRDEQQRYDPPPDDPQADAANQEPSDPEAVARAICLRLLTQRARSRSELAGALRRRGVSDDAATAVLDRFRDVGLIDDAALATTMAGAAHRERGLAGRAVAARLRRRGIDEDDVRSAVATIDGESEREQALRLVRKRLPATAALEPTVRARRLVGLLARKGYSAGLAYQVVRTVLAEAGAEVESLDAVIDQD